jgi:hypothetical protein
MHYIILRFPKPEYARRHLSEVTNTTCIFWWLRILTWYAGFGNADGVFSGRLYIRTLRAGVAQLHNCFVTAAQSDCKQRGPGKWRTRNVNSDIRLFSPVPEVHTVTIQILDSSIMTFFVNLKHQHFEIHRAELVIPLSLTQNRSLWKDHYCFRHLSINDRVISKLLGFNKYVFNR